MRSAKLAGACACKARATAAPPRGHCAGCRGQRQTAVGREPPGKSSGVDATTGRSCLGISASEL